MAQEESLAIATGLYSTLIDDKVKDYYLENRKTKDCVYTDHIIYSGNVPVFRDDDCNLLDTVHTTSFITCPAVNTKHAEQRVGMQAIEYIMKERAKYVLTVALQHDHSVVVLGAWGCGVFGNNPRIVGYIFRELLLGPRAKFRNLFEKVIFAVTSEGTLTELEDGFYARGNKQKLRRNRNRGNPIRGRARQAKRNNRKRKQDFWFNE
eukprot:TRINITY_DN3290_c0_g2_i2.p1 TRINITY_DN3290_c0_g2~~TRINITY_DN3290_c0_g2_i2.p1  ORF type:complete len:207 (+),score=43.74 TRINITY_DN3290_c0_g2_i2:400-1020(+)